jgi:hypothetical protein
MKAAVLLYLWAGLCLNLTMDHAHRSTPGAPILKGGGYWFAVFAFQFAWPVLIPGFWWFTRKSRRPF